MSSPVPAVIVAASIMPPSSVLSRSITIAPAPVKRSTATRGVAVSSASMPFASVTVYVPAATCSLVLGEQRLVVGDLRLARVERGHRHHRQDPVVGRAGAVEVHRREPADLVVLGEVARVVLEVDRAERAARVGAGLREAVRRRRADEAAAVREPEAAGADPRIDLRGGVGDLGQRRRARAARSDQQQQRCPPHRRESIPPSVDRERIVDRRHLGAAARRELPRVRPTSRRTPPPADCRASTAPGCA